MKKILLAAALVGVVGAANAEITISNNSQLSLAVGNGAVAGASLPEMGIDANATVTAGTAVAGSIIVEARNDDLTVEAVNQSQMSLAVGNGISGSIVIKQR